MIIDFSQYLGKWGLTAEPDCYACNNTGIIETQAASVTIEVPCPECSRSDDPAYDDARGWAEQ